MSASISNKVIFYDRYFLKTLFSIPKFKLSHPPKNPAVMPTVILAVNGMAKSPILYGTILNWSSICEMTEMDLGMVVTNLSAIL